MASSQPWTVRSSALKASLLLFLWAGAAAYGWTHLDHGWIPHDEGLLAHPAQRVLAGELPHRDFDDLYTGGLAFANAAAFKLLGERLFSMRLVMFAVFILWIPVVYYVARYFASFLLALLATACAVAFSIPLYPAAMPSWYNLFFATFALGALLRYLTVRRGVWLMAAGLAAGFSIVVKIVGLYLVAAVLVILAFIEQAETTGGSVADSGAHRGLSARPYSILLTGCAALLTLALVKLVGLRVGPQGLVHFVLPTASVLALLVAREWRLAAEATSTRLIRVGGMVLPFLTGLAIPLLIFLVSYVTSGSLDTLYRGLFVLPQTRFAFANNPPPPLVALLFSAPAVALVTLGERLPREGLLRRGLVIGTLAGVALSFTELDTVYRFTWLVFLNLPPIVVPAAVLYVAFGARRSVGGHLSADTARRRLAVLVPVTATALVGLVQFPYATPIYFAYVAPLVILTAVAMTSWWDRRPSPELAVVIGFCALFLVARAHGGPVPQLGYSLAVDVQTERLELERASLRVTLEHKRSYESVVALLREHARGGYIFVTPDAPELYFLSGLADPTRTLLELFEDRTNRTQRTLEMLDEYDVQVVAINEEPKISGLPAPQLLASLEDRYPVAQKVGQFVVRWSQ